jgi:hypothetical protein
VSGWGQKASGPGLDRISFHFRFASEGDPNYRATSDQCTAPCSCGANYVIKSGADLTGVRHQLKAPSSVLARNRRFQLATIAAHRPASRDVAVSSASPHRHNPKGREANRHKLPLRRKREAFTRRERRF